LIQRRSGKTENGTHLNFLYLYISFICISSISPITCISHFQLFLLYSCSSCSKKGDHIGIARIFGGTIIKNTNKQANNKATATVLYFSVLAFCCSLLLVIFLIVFVLLFPVLTLLFLLPLSRKDAASRKFSASCSCPSASSRGSEA